MSKAHASTTLLLIGITCLTGHLRDLGEMEFGDNESAIKSPTTVAFNSCQTPLRKQGDSHLFSYSSLDVIVREALGTEH